MLGSAWLAVPALLLVSSQKPVPDRVQKFTEQGVSVELTIEPVHGDPKADPRQGEEVRVQFKITDSSGNPLSGFGPIAWMDLRRQGPVSGAEACRQKVQSFLQASFSARPLVDLNRYFVLALNRDPTITVIDPQRGFGDSKLAALVDLASPGEDWALSDDRKRLFVSLPAAGQVAAVETVSWKIEGRLDAGENPRRVVLQADGRYLWVGNDGGVTIIDTAGPKTVAHIGTGAGRHDIAVTAGDRYALITNYDDGTLAVIDVHSLKRIKTLRTGPRPAAIAYSSLSRSAYVAHEGDGTITVVDGDRHEITGTLKTAPGLTTVRFAPGGRWAFALNGKEGTAYVADTSTHQVAHRIEVGSGPDQVTFTKDFAYIRLRRSDEVKLVALSGLARTGPPNVSDFPGGQMSPEKSEAQALAPAIVPAPEDGAALVANAGDGLIYYYHEGMAAPKGNFKNYGHQPTAVLVVDRNLREITPGVYSTAVKLDRAGSYDVALMLDSPRLVHCFDAAIQPNPALGSKQEVAIRIEPLLGDRRTAAGQEAKIRFRVVDKSTGQPRADLEDVRVLMFLAAGNWQRREWARPAGDGIYEAVFSPPDPGVYYLFFECPSLKLRFNQQPFVTLQVVQR